MRNSCGCPGINDNSFLCSLSDGLAADFNAIATLISVAYTRNLLQLLSFEKQSDETYIADMLKHITWEVHAQYVFLKFALKVEVVVPMVKLIENTCVGQQSRTDDIIIARK